MGRIFYRTMLVLSVIIVGLYCTYHVLAERPTQAPPAAAIPAKSNPTDDPLTPEREDLAEPGGLERKANCWTFLLAASDQSSGNADTIMVGMYDTVNQKAGLVSIPRDTLASRQYHKINSAYKEGPEELRRVVSTLLGIPIDYYVTVDIDGFKALVDAVGGVDFDIPVHMSYDDPTQDLHIHFEPGVTHLDGQAAMEVARCRKNSDGKGKNVIYDAYPDADIGRTRTQQALLQALAKKIMRNPQKLPQYLDIFSTYVDTDLSGGEIAWFASPALGFDLSTGFSSATLPGDGAVTYRGTKWCYQLYPEETLQIINELINPYTTDVTLDMTSIPQVS